MSEDPEGGTSARPSPIRVPSIPDVVYETLRTDIAHGVYQPGPISIRQLAERFGVSAMPVREALRRLQAEGFVSFPGARQVAIIGLSLADLEEIFSMRSELESLALRTAVPMLAADEVALRKLESLISEMDAHMDAHIADEYDAWRQANQAFHLSLYGAANKPRLLTTVSSLGAAVEPYARRYGVIGDGLQIAQNQHREILEAVRAGDEVRATAVLREHLDAALDVFTQALGDA